MPPNSLLVIQIRHGQFLMAETPYSPARAVQIAEIYPYYRCRYPEKGDLEATLSIWSGRDKYNFLLQQVLCALETHKNFFTAGGPTPQNILNLAASLSLKHAELELNDPNNVIHNSLMFLNKILETSPYLGLHQFLFDAYCACTFINQHSIATHAIPDAAKDMQEEVVRAYESLLESEVNTKQFHDAQRIPRRINTVAALAPGALLLPPAINPYSVLGIASLENGGNCSQWCADFETTLNGLLHAHGLKPE